MKKQLFVTLQTPFILLPVTGTDGAGDKTTIFVKFKRRNIEEAQKRFDEYSDIFTEKNQNILKEKLNNFLFEEIISFEKITLPIYDVESDPPVKIGEIVVKDSLKEKESDFWTSPEECKKVLFDLFISSQVWGPEITKTLITALTNKEQKEFEKGN